MFYKVLAYRYQGIRRTLERLTRSYYLEGVAKLVIEVVYNYDTCIYNKAM